MNWEPSVQKEAIVAEVTGASGKDLKEDDEFRHKERQRKEQEEKFRRFEMRERELKKAQ